MKKVLVSLFALLCITSVSAQETEEVSISADRPGMATGVDVMPFLKVQLETGVQYDRTKDGNAFTLPTAMLRFGVTKFAELRLEYDGTLDDSEDWKYGVEPLTLGTKIKVFDGWKWVPKVSFLANLAIPATTEQARNSHVAPSLYLLFQNDVCDWFNIGYNVGAEWDGVTATPNTFLALCLGFSITDSFGAFLESYNYFTKQSMSDTDVDPYIDFGFNYVVTPRVQLDVYGSISCKNPEDYANVGLGVAWLIN